MTHTEFTGELAAILHIGAGECLEMESHLATGAKHIVLVEAAPQAATRLRDRFGADPRISIIEKAIAGETGARTLRVFGFADATSLRVPTDVEAIFPSLGAAKEIDVEAKAANTFVASLDFSPDEQNGLLIETPGEEYAIVKSLAEANLLFLFTEIVVHAARAPLYEGAGGAKDVSAILKDAGYNVTANPNDPDRPVLTARLPPLFREHRSLVKETDYLKEQLQELAFREAQYESELGKVEAQLELIKDVLLRD